MTDKISLTKSAIDRISELREKPENKNKFLRITVHGGGCSGFRYEFSLDNQLSATDFVIKEKNYNIFAIDDISFNFLKNSEIDFTSELGAAYFKIKNPNATSSCGCGDSFSV